MFRLATNLNHPLTLLIKLKCVVEVEVPCRFVPEFPIPARYRNLSFPRVYSNTPRSDRVRKEIWHEETCG
jgi:hypothetical protein